MSSSRIGPVSVLVSSLLLFGCEAQSPDPQDGTETLGTSGGEMTDTLLSLGETTSPDSTNEATASAPSSSSSAPAQTSSSSTSSSAPTTSELPSSSAESSTGQETQTQAPLPRTIEFFVPNHKALKGEKGSSELRLTIAPMGSADSKNSILDTAVRVDAEGKVSVTVDEPETAPDKASKLQQFMVTLYRDTNEDSKAGKGDEFTATVLEFLVYRANLEPARRWRKFDPKTRKAVAIEDAIPMVSVWDRPERKEAMLGGKVSVVHKDIKSVALFSEMEKLDLKKNFSLALRSLDYKIPRDKLFWEARVSGNMDRRRWAKPDLPVLSGIGNHGLSWFAGYHTPTFTVFPTVRRNSTITDELCHGPQTLVAIWIEKSKTWVQSMSGAFVVAYHNLAPGWNIVKIDRTPGQRVSFHQISKEERYDLSFAPICDGTNRSASHELPSPELPRLRLE